MENKPSIAVIGGGIMGISLAYFLSRQGIHVEVFEASPAIGGLAGSICLDDGTEVDRFYHAILSSDVHLIGLCNELGIADRLRFNDTRMGFYFKGQVYSMNNIVEFLRFPPLNWIDRFRLGLTIVYAQFLRDWQKLEHISVEKWLVSISGRTTFENIWKPMLRAKFDGNFEDTPATYIWSRLVRMKSTRSGVNQKEQAGHLVGGFDTILKAMAKRIEQAGGKIHLNVPVSEIIVENGEAVGIEAEGLRRTFNSIVATIQAPLFKQLLPKSHQDYKQWLSQIEYLGIITPLLVLDRPLTGYWTLNITDDRIPFTGVIETTTFIDPQFVGGHHLVYLPKYIAPASEMKSLTDEAIRETWLQNLEAMFPQFDRRWIYSFTVNRETFVEPIHGLDKTSVIPTMDTPIRNLYLATTSQIYPVLTNGESVTRHARRSANQILEDLKTTQKLPL